MATSPNHVLKADTGFRLILSCRSWGQGGRDPGNEVSKAGLLSLFWRRDFDVFVFLFSTVKSNSPKPTEEEEKEKAPQTEESEETEKEEDTKMEH